ncbi:MAG: hypothetical protein VYA84_20645 [Planctomycetota bacterium]|nr:hypothetical protein [Planctomycetota bacterium]
MAEMTQAQPKPSATSRRTRAGQGWCIPRTARRFGEKLMSQQLWCWGRDVLHPEGNLLMQFGFERHRDNDPAERSTCYRLDEKDLHVCLWGFGMFFGSRQLGGLYLSRFDFIPTWAPVESVCLGLHWPDELPFFSRPQGESQWKRARKLWTQSMRWIASYESWIRENTGVLYRRDCVDTWLRPFVRAEKTVAAWRYLSRQPWTRPNQPLKQMLDQYTFSEKQK